MCCSILYFKPSTEKDVSSKNLNALDSYLCDVILPALLIVCLFLFCGTKKNEQDFLPGEKNRILLSFLRSIFLFPAFLCSFIIPFTEDSIIFIKLIFSVLLFLIIDLDRMFSLLSY